MTLNIFSKKKALLLDMNSTFMFGEDNFGIAEDFSKHYHGIGGQLTRFKINDLIRKTYNYLTEIYPDVEFQHDFPSVESVIKAIVRRGLPETEVLKIVDTFAFHEIGYIPERIVTF